MGKLIVFEGIDGSGKSTQFKRICDRFEAAGVSFRRLAFPQYQEMSSALIKMYLAGEFGADPADVNPYAASSFFAVDRYASFVKDWGGYYSGGGLILTDRYTTSNALHQGSKLPERKRPAFFKWLYDFEFNKMGMPKPDTVLYLDIPVETAAARIQNRQARTGTDSDIHERDIEYLKCCASSGLQAANYYGWKKIACIRDGQERAAQDVHAEIYELLISEVPYDK
ncbi:thymidylate kinase [Oscillospiraceae bacterium WX1]